MNKERKKMDEYKEFGVDKEDMEKQTDYKPTFNPSTIELGEVFKCTVDADSLRKIEVATGDKGEKQERYLLAIVDEDGVEMDMWVTAKSLRMEFLKLKQKVGTEFNGTKVILVPREYDHPKWGTTRGYTVQRQKDES